MDGTEMIHPDLMSDFALYPKNILPASSYDPSVFFRRISTSDNSSKRAMVTYGRVDREKRNHACEHCGKVFDKRWQLLVHVKIHSQEKSQAATSTRVNSVKHTVCDGILKGMPEHKCVCGIVFPSKWILSKHMKKHHTGKTIKLHECEICKKCFRSSSYLNIHRRAHMGGKPYTCEICDNSYARLDSLVRHKKWIHGGKKKIPKPKIHACGVCDKSFSNSNLLIQHITVHTGEKMYKCDYCDKSYSAKKYLTQHVRRSHGNENPITSPFALQIPVNESRPSRVNRTCDICNKTFCTTKLLKEHRNIHTGEKMFECNYCDRKFNFRSNYNLHKKRWHSDKQQRNDVEQTVEDVPHLEEEEEKVKEEGKAYKCNVCSNEYKCFKTFTKHVESHSEITDDIQKVEKKLHVCELCGRSFSMRNSLNRHRRTHTGEKPYACEICGRSFAIKYNADKHMRNHSKEETVTMKNPLQTT